MKGLLIAAALTASTCAGGLALAQDQKGPDDHEAGVPLAAAEAAGSWTVATGGRDVCQLTMGAGHTVKAPAECRTALTGAPTSWFATNDGMRLTDANGQTVLAFHRWSNSLFVSHRASHVDVQLRRGGPVSSGG